MEFYERVGVWSIVAAIVFLVGAGFFFLLWVGSKDPRDKGKGLSALIAFGLAVAVAIVSFQFGPAPAAEVRAPVAKTAQELAIEAEAARVEKIKKQFDAWDGSHRNFERLIKAAMNDPDSYKHVKTIYFDNVKYLVVQTTFRGKNAFGGTVTDTARVKVDLEGNILEVLDEK